MEVSTKEVSEQVWIQQRKELDIDWCLGSFLPAELIDIICDDPLQPEEADDDDTEFANVCDSVQEEPSCCDSVQE